MADDKLREKLTEYVEDARAMEQNVLQLLNSQIATTRDEQFKAMLEHHKHETEGQVQRLAQRLDAMGERPSPVKDIGARAMAVPKGLFDQLRGDKPGRNARDGYATEHLEIAAYQLLERVARRAGDDATAGVARQNRAEEEEMAREIDASWDRVVELTLAEEGIAVRMP
jgi:ferritin-like metal-binding protein YciE